MGASNPRVGSPGNRPPAPFLRGLSKSHVINITEDPPAALNSQEMPKVLGAWGGKPRLASCCITTSQTLPWARFAAGLRGCGVCGGASDAGPPALFGSVSAFYFIIFFKDSVHLFERE